MRVGIIPENPLEWVALRFGLAPIPLGESWFTFLLARAIMVGTKLGVFEALAAGPLSADAVAARIGTEPRATAKLLNALVGARYLGAARDGYSLTPMARKWLLAGSSGSARDKVLFQFLEWDVIARSEEFVRTGQPLRLHEMLTDEQWELYQRGMRSGIEPMAREVARRLPVPRGARAMLDIGGSHGYYSVLLCRRHPELRSTILDLPEAIRFAAPILAREGMGDRVVHQAGDALATDLGENAYDVVFIAALVHHFSDEQNRALMKRVARALRPNGVVAIYEALRLDPATGVGQVGGLMDLFFAMTSQSGTWSAEEMAGWQRDAGLVPRKPMRLRLARDLGIQAATKRAP